MADIPVFGLDEVDPSVTGPKGTTGTITVGTGGAVTQNANYWSDYFRNNFGHYTPLPDYQTQQQDEARRAQQGIIQDLQLQASGSLDTRAQKELTANNKLGQKSQYAIASGQKGGDMRAASAGAGRVAGQLGSQQSALKLQEQQSSQQLLAQLLAQQQGQDIASAQGQSEHTLNGRALEDAYNQFMASQGIYNDATNSQLTREEAGSKLGIDIAAADATRRGVGQAADAVGTGLSTLLSQSDKKPANDLSNPNTRAIDDAFNGD